MGEDFVNMQFLQKLAANFSVLGEYMFPWAEEKIRPRAVCGLHPGFSGKSKTIKKGIKLGNILSKAARKCVLQGKKTDNSHHYH